MAEESATRSVKRLCVFAGARSGSRVEFTAQVKVIGREIAKQGMELVYGGASIGLMGVLADAVLDSGGDVIGVVPRKLFQSEVPHARLTKMYKVSSMHRRKALMADLADAFLALPGGFGTFDELFEIVTWAQIGLHRKPIGLYNISGYFDPLLALIEHAVSEGFISSSDLSLLLHDCDAVKLLRHLTNQTSSRVRASACRDSSLPER